MEQLNYNDNISDLSDDQMRLIFGGQPSKETEFWYDFFYLVTFTSVVNPKPTAWATSVGLF